MDNRLSKLSYKEQYYIMSLFNHGTMTVEQCLYKLELKRRNALLYSYRYTFFGRQVLYIKSMKKPVKNNLYSALAKYNILKSFMPFARIINCDRCLKLDNKLFRHIK